MSEHLHELLQAVRDGSVSVEQAELELKKAPFEDLGYAKIDFHRSLRQGAAEVIYGAGKTPAQIAGIAAAMREKGVEPILITRLSPEAAALVASARREISVSCGSPASPRQSLPTASTTAASCTV